MTTPRSTARPPRPLAGAIVAAAAALLLAPAPAFGQPAPGEPAAAPEGAPTLASAPALRALVPAEVPPGTRFPAPVVEVILEIDVDDGGRVTDVRLARGAGEPFDAAALAAARRFDFEPGRLTTGEAVPVTVTFRLRITAPPPPPPRPVRLEGVLLERGTRRPLAGIDVEARADDALLARTTTGADGAFALEVPATRFTLRAAPPGHERLEADVEAAAGEERAERFYLERAEGDFETTVRGRATRREVTRQVIAKETVTTVAGTQGDTLKAVQNLPGVGRASFGAGALVLRGSAPGDSRVFLEGQEIPLLYHFGGLRSTFNSAFLEAVELYPGNFGPDYGRATGGVVEVRVREPARDLVRGEVDVNFYDAGGVIEGPLGGHWAGGVAFHRSYIDSVLPLVIPDDASLSFDTAPRYYDYQALASWRPDGRRHLRLFFYGSRDRVELLFDRPTDDPTVRGALAARIAFHSLQASYRSPLVPGSGIEQETTARLGLQEISTEIGPEYFFDLDVELASFRTTLSADPARWLGWRAGMDLLLSGVDISLLVPQEGGASQSTVIGVTKGATIYNPAAFGELRLRPDPAMIVLPSVRLDWYGQLERWAIDPRLAVRLEPIPETSVAAGVGVFQQPPAPDQADPDSGTSTLLPERSLHASVGVERRAGPVDVQVTGFAKKLDRLVVRNPLASFDPRADRFTNDGAGRVHGVELLARLRPGTRFDGWLAYTFQRSLRRDATEEPERRFEFDQPHLLTFVGSVRLGRGWSGSLRFRVASGNPSTPVVGSIYDAATDVWVPRDGAEGSERLATFHQLDLRVDRTWSFRTYQLSAYLDVQNAYNRANPEGWRYRYDYAEREPVTGLPIVPILGARGAW